MKKTLVMLYKVAFWIIFLHYFGIFRFIASSPLDSSRPNISYQETIQREQVVRTYLNKEIEQAITQEKNGGHYSPYEYFQALKEMYRLEDSIGFEIPFNSGIQTLQQHMQASLTAKFYDYNDIAKARDESNVVNRLHQKNTHNLDLSWSSIKNWLWQLYLHMLPYTLFLFLIWIYQRKENAYELSIKSPVCFLFLLLIHPLYIVVVVRRAWMEFGAEVELRRRKKNAFARLSTEETLLIAKLAKSSISFKEYLSHMKVLGTRKHSFWIAVIAIVMADVPVSATIQSSTLVPCAQTALSHASDTPPAIVCDVGVRTGPSFATIHEIDSWCIIAPLLIAMLYGNISIHILLSSGYPETREPVPLYY